MPVMTQPPLLQPPGQHPGPQPPSPGRDRTALWAFLTLAVLLAASLALLILLVTGGRLPDLGNGPSWTPAAEPATAAQPIVATPDPAQRSEDRPFLPGDPARNVSGGSVNLRWTPGYLSKPAGDVIAIVAADAMVTVLGGPQLADGLQWWNVRSGSSEGWMAERSSQGLVLLAPVD